MTDLDDLFASFGLGRTPASRAQEAMKQADAKAKAKVVMPKITVQRDEKGVALLRATLVADMLDALKDDRLKALARRLREL